MDTSDTPTQALHLPPGLTLTADEARVLGALIEKQITTPEYYPLTLNALIAACNQKSNRDPVLALDERRWFWRWTSCETRNWRGRSRWRGTGPTSTGTPLPRFFMCRRCACRC
jgi:hypothetical protein